MGRMFEGVDRKKALAWALYDFGNSAFATTVMAAFFPAFFKAYWAKGADATESTFYLGVANSAGSILVALLAPALGAIADSGGVRRRFLVFFAFLGAAMSAALFLVEAGAWPLAALLYVAAVVGFSGGNVFYDALLVGVAEPRKLDLVSALGYAAGYLGGGLLFLVQVLAYQFPERFGLPDGATAIRLSFLSVGVWWLVFTVPLLLFVDEPEASSTGRGWAVVTAGFRQLKETFRHARRLKHTFLFLLAYWLYIDGVDTVVRMAVDYGLALGLPESTPIVALLVVQFVGFPAALAFGPLAERIGAKRGIYLALSVYAVVCVLGYFMDSAAEFYLLAVLIALVQGGVQSLSRSLYARLVPEGKSAEFFGLYNMLGKFAAVLGPLLMGGVAVLTGSSRLGILSLLVLFLAGAALLARVDVAQGRHDAMEGGRS